MQITRIKNKHLEMHIAILQDTFRREKRQTFSQITNDSLEGILKAFYKDVKAVQNLAMVFLGM